MSWTLLWVAAAVGLCAALILLDPNVPLDCEDYWVILFIEKMIKVGRTKRYLFGGPVIQGKGRDSSGTNLLSYLTLSLSLTSLIFFLVSGRVASTSSARRSLYPKLQD